MRGIARWDGRRWTSVGGGVQGYALAFAVFDDDGAGPGAPALFVGGQFTAAGGVACQSVAKWNGSGWTPVGSGVGGGPPAGAAVLAMTAFDEDGAGPLPAALFAAGNFTLAGERPAACIARWDGTSWTAVGGGITGGLSPAVLALEVFDPDGAGAQPASLYAGGQFATAGGAPASAIARWDGTSWLPLGSGVLGGVSALARFDEDGQGPEPERLIIGGSFSWAGGINSPHLVRWDGVAWSRLGPPGVDLMGGGVSSLAVLQDHAGGTAQPTLYVGGSFFSIGQLTIRTVARWTATGGWASVGAVDQITGSPAALIGFDPDGAGPRLTELVIGGDVAIQDGGVPYALRWDGSDWIGLDSGVAGRILTFLSADPDGPGPGRPRLYVGGEFTQVQGVKANRIAAWDGSAWSPLGPGMLGSSSRVSTLAMFDEDGEGPDPPNLFAGGYLFRAGSAEVFSIARWNGSGWSPVGGGVNPGASVKAMAVHDEDEEGPIPPALFVGGSFTNAGGAQIYGIARWNGSAWSDVGGGMSGDVNALAVLDEDGAGPGRPVLVAGGAFSSAGGRPANRVATWNGVMWNPMGTGLDGTVATLAVLDTDGPGPTLPTLMAGGAFSGGVKRWAGSAVWALAGSMSLTHSLAVADPDGDGPQPPALFAGGTFLNSWPVQLNRVARWEGLNEWSPLGSGINNDVFAVGAFDDDGPGPMPPAVYFGGYFTAAGGVSSGGIARWGCPRCYANCDGSIVAPLLNINDFQCFLNRYASGDPYANCDGSTLPPVLNVNDFLCYQTRYAQGCP